VDEFSAVADLLKVLGQETRLRLLQRLADGERCVCDLCPEVGEQSNVSRHLALLTRAGLLAHRVEGTRHYYRVVRPDVFEVLDVTRRVVKT
jgi:ArsR family transcriptional regulator